MLYLYIRSGRDGRSSVPRLGRQLWSVGGSLKTTGYIQNKHTLFNMFLFYMLFNPPGLPTDGRRRWFCHRPHTKAQVRVFLAPDLSSCASLSLMLCQIPHSTPHVCRVNHMFVIVVNYIIHDNNYFARWNKAFTCRTHAF